MEEVKKQQERDARSKAVKSEMKVAEGKDS
jgi:hypothetical protein